MDKTLYYKVDDEKVIEIGTWLDAVIEWMPKDHMTRKPEIIGHDDENNVVVRWHYPDVIFTLRMARSWDKLVGKTQVFVVSDIELLEDKHGRN